MRAKLLILCIAIILIACKSNQNIAGKYSSNFAENGFFITKIDLKHDKSFHYKFSGDLIHTELDGSFKIKDNTLYLRFDKLKREIDISDTITNWFNENPYDLKRENGIEYHLKYKIRGNRLYTYNLESGKIVRRIKKYTNRRKYIVFGPKCYKKEWYLRKIDE